MKYQNHEPATNCVIELYLLFSRPEVFCEKDDLNNFAKFTEKYLDWVSFLIKLQAGGVKSTFFIEHLWATASIFSEIQSTFDKKIW